MIYAQATKKDVLIAAQAMTSPATVTANLDTVGAGYASVDINFGAELNANGVGPTISLLESDDTVATNFATITADLGAVTLTAEKLVRYDVDLRGRKRYLRLSVTTATATNDDITFAANSILSRLGEAPSSTTEMGDVAVIV